MAPAAPADLDKVMVQYAIDAGGVGGDAGGDGGAAGGAGDGSPLRRITVTLIDAKGQQVSGTTDDNGKFLLKFQTSTFAAPFVVRAIDAGGNVLSSTTEEAAASGKVVRINVNPLTDKITSDAIAATVAGTDKAFDGSKVDVSKLASAKGNLVTSVKDALTVAGVADSSKFDPVRSVYDYNGTGVDAVIESISHTRDAATGETQLRAKLVPLQTAADGSVTPTLITAATPLPTTAVAVAGNPAMTFDKITAWMNEVNRCFALSSAARDADADCDDADGTRLVSTNFKHNSKDLPETYRALFSESDLSAVQGSALRNPLVLFTTPAGTNGYESAVVEFTVNQPRTGPLSGNLSTPLQYTITTVFRRDDSLTRAKAGNWILHGNQRSYDVPVQPRFVQTLQANPARQANSSGNSPSNLSSALTFSPQLLKFDVPTRTYVSADLRAMRIKGPGLPDAGLVYSQSTTPGTTYLTIDNKIGQVGTGSMINSNSNPNYTLSSVALDGSALYPGFWNAARVSNADAPLTDFSSMQAYSRYTYEVFLNSNPGNTTPDAVETVRILAPVMPPSFSGALQRNDFTPSMPLVTAPADGGCSFTLNWTNNLNAARVDGGFVFGANFNVTPQIQSVINVGVNSSSVGTRPSSVTATAAGTGPSGCGANAIPPLETTPGGAAFRQIGLGATQARYRIFTYLQWN
ncbi:hypothetical protein QTI66_17225 [Variovorax sp. J22R133]|uniref:hypothetical protein n=1 Tax=Variovorax brevis TaxID=3053503 RepID=UPI002575D836|nr:hypothetical protein [Variovorax sp. J22R133]MDM0113902.1 hypothetical protein [Variovorax sp. J22R133]